MNNGSPNLSPAIRCWSEVGIWGNRTCLELPRVGHCRNCEVYSAGGDELLARPVPEDYLATWGQLLATRKEDKATGATPYVVFRIGPSWFGLRALALREVMQPGIIRALPHLRSNALLGITAVRGEIYPCVSLHALLGNVPVEVAGPGVRFLVAIYQGGDWVFAADEVNGIHDVLQTSVVSLPATMIRSEGTYTTGITQCAGHFVGLLDEELLFSSLQRRIG
jgi:chemotaxis-related protein WspD